MKLIKTIPMFMFIPIVSIDGMNQQKSQLRKEKSCPLPIIGAKSSSTSHTPPQDWRKSLQKELAQQAVLQAQTDSPRTHQKAAAKKADEVYPISYDFDARASEESFKPFQELP